MRRRLCRERRRGTPFSSDHLSSGDSDNNYRPRSRTPPSESFLCDEERRYRRRGKNPSHRGLGNDAMSRTLNQISKSPFTRRIEMGKLLRRFAHPTFTIYNGRTDPVEHVSHFN